MKMFGKCILELDEFAQQMSGGRGVVKECPKVNKGYGIVKECPKVVNKCLGIVKECPKVVIKCLGIDSSAVMAVECNGTE